MDAGSAMRTVVIVAVLVAAGLYGSLLALLAWQQRRFIYVPDRRRPDVSAAGVAGILALRVRTQDGLDLLAWVTPAADERQPVVLYLHGNGGHIGYRAPRLAWMTRLGWGVMLLEYRGFGGNPGSPTEAGLYEDARAGYAALRGGGSWCGASRWAPVWRCGWRGRPKLARWCWSRPTPASCRSDRRGFHSCRSAGCCAIVSI